MRHHNFHQWIWLAVCVTTLFVAPGRADTPTNKLWFDVGEELFYDIHWGVFHVGQTHVTTSWTNHEGRPALLIRYVTKTNKFVEKFYPVDDLLESMIDPDTFLPFYFRKNLSEGRYRADELTVFDRDKMEMRWKSFTNGREKTRPIEKDTRDVVSIMYFIRGQPLQLNATNSHRVMADEKIYDLQITAGREEKMSLGEWGAVRCCRVDPKASFQGLFVRKGRITFWVSLDERHLCTRIMAAVPVANIRLTLTDVKGPGDDFWMKPVAKKEKRYVPERRR